MTSHHGGKKRGTQTRKGQCNRKTTTYPDREAPNLIKSSRAQLRNVGIHTNDNKFK